MSKHVTDRSDEVRSFVTFALASKPSLSIHRRTRGSVPDTTLTIATKRASVGSDAYTDIDALLAKYESARPYLKNIVESMESIATCTPTVSFEPGVDYALIRISEGQFRLARELASRLEVVREARESGDAEAFRELVESLQSYIAEQRAALVGEFVGTEFSDAEITFGREAVAAYGADRVATADANCSGAVIFVVIEIFLV